MSFYDDTSVASGTYDNHIVTWEKTKSKIDDEGIWEPKVDFVLRGSTPDYKLIIPKDMFIEAYNRWIKGDTNG